MKIERQFKKRSLQEQEWLCSETWCEKCEKPDLGLINPEEYEEFDEIIIKGFCKVCSSVVKSVVQEVAFDECSTETRHSHIEICLSAVKTKHELHLLLKSKLSFPEFYGCNWDAFWDAITGLVSMPKELKLSGWKEFEETLPSEAIALKKCLEEMAQEFPMKASMVTYA